MCKISYVKNIPMRSEYDVVVCGGGPAGIGAAVASSEKGAKTLLVERLGFLGGMATAGLVNPMSEFAYNNRRVIGGAAWRFAKKLEEAGGAIIEYPRCNISFNPEIYKLTAQRFVIDSGAEILSNSYIADCIVEDNSVTEIIIAGKNGLEAIKGRYFIDATGDACLAAYAGMEMLPNTKPIQPGTLCFTMSGVDTTTERMHIIHQKTQGFNHHALFIRNTLLNLREHGVYVPQFGGPWLCTTLKDGDITLNLTRASMDASNSESYNNAEMKMLEDVLTFSDLLTKYIDEFKGAHISSVATIAGTRQSRRIKGIHILTGEEYLKGVKFDDSVARACHAIDIHLPNDEGQILKFPNDAGYIPYDSMINENFNNIIVAGRAISADEEAFAAVRVQAPCMEIGQAAGIAANICIKQGNVSVKNIDRSELVAQVRAEGSFV